ncbi:MAG: hypothetical protein JNK87_00120 [Bryobacterales bacterium]|nr:hypothetical protein [Bryobacterales bacterium]
MSVAVLLFAGQFALPSEVRHRACRYWHVLEAVRASDTPTNLVEKMVFSLFFAEAGWPAPTPPARAGSGDPT